MEDDRIPSLAKALNTPEITKAAEKVSKTKDELNGLYDTIESIEDDVRAELKGTGATESYIRALITERSKPLLKQVNSLERRYENEAGDLKYLTDNAKDDFKYQYDAYEKEQAAAAEAASSEKEYNRKVELVKLQDELERNNVKTAEVDGQLYMYDPETKEWNLAVKKAAEVQKPVKIGTDANGNDVMGIFDFNTNSYKRVSSDYASPVVLKPVDVKFGDKTKTMLYNPVTGEMTDVGKYFQTPTPGAV